LLACLTPAGCAQAPIIRMASLEQATIVQLEDAGDPSRQGDETLFVLDEAPYRDKVTAFLRQRAGFWRPTGDLPHPARYTLTFKKNGETTAEFWLGARQIETKDKSGATHAITLSDAEVEELVELFHWTRHFKNTRA